MEAEAVSSEGTGRPAAGTRKNDLAPMSPGASADEDIMALVATVDKARRAALNVSQVSTLFKVIRCVCVRLFVYQVRYVFRRVSGLVVGVCVRGSVLTCIGGSVFVCLAVLVCRAFVCLWIVCACSVCCAFYFPSPKGLLQGGGVSTNPDINAQFSFYLIFFHRAIISRVRTYQNLKNAAREVLLFELFAERF